VHGRLSEAVEHARDALKWDRPRQTRADDLLTLAEALGGLGEEAEAESAMRESVELWPDNPRLASARSNLRETGVG
jgi:Flp pilus assembly protein TadD